ncbi:MAG: ribosome maturation factor RimP [Candidatus Eremiobacteraeota bacterium]|nr:ribosome maturation factor RimP [Candidatus Eremiobacteraeota bacterium]MBV9056427.1 ribosome maturation factor RimP [Candidatus Eremiobacteraeota bacterium]MBV9698578.1 ribosome maturation factor RimP [Candidatus Eremiobacteraeota bacterium]
MARVATEIARAFEQELDDIEHDPSFGALEIVTREARTVRGALALRVTIDRPGGVDVALCERVASRLNAALGSLDGNYMLEVESAGLDRPLVRAEDYDRFAGSAARIVTTLTVNGGKTHRGTLRGMRGEAVLLETERGELLLPVAAIKSANLEFDPRADFQRDKLQRKQLHGYNRKHRN